MNDHALSAILALPGIKSSGKNAWNAPCPAHKDKNPSFSIRITPDGVVLMHCFAGCCIEDIAAAMGLKLEDLFPQEQVHHGKASRFNPVQILRAIAHEALIIELLVREITPALREKEGTRLRLALERIHEAMRLAGV